MHYSQRYRELSAPWRRSSQGAAILAALDKVLVAVIAGAYGVALVWLLSSNDDRLVRVIAVPALLLVAVSLLRALLNRPRPYEEFDIEPLLSATTKGRSMPSRHVACAFVIACALGYLNPVWGIGAGVAALLVAYARVVGGVHFPRDVLAGAALGLLFGLVGFVVL